jgi:hypothetical protein
MYLLCTYFFLYGPRLVIKRNSMFLLLNFSDICATLQESLFTPEQRAHLIEPLDTNLAIIPKTVGSTTIFQACSGYAITLIHL